MKFLRSKSALTTHRCPESFSATRTCINWWSLRGTIPLMILSGWKEIAEHLRCGVRTAQRWERFGLPVRRPVPERRSLVVADPDELDSWRHDNAFWRRKDWDVLAIVERARKLRAEVKQTRARLRSSMESLKKELTRIAAEQQRRSPTRGVKRLRASSLSRKRQRGSQLHERH